MIYMHYLGKSRAGEVSTGSPKIRRVNCVEVAGKWGVERRETWNLIGDRRGW
jgi:hypothetical protein